MKGWILIITLFCLFEFLIGNCVIKWGDKVIFEHYSYIKVFQIK